MSQTTYSFCLDPSCFISLDILNNTLKVVEVCKNNYELFVPSDIYNIIILELEEKFKKFPVIIREWLKSNNDITK